MQCCWKNNFIIFKSQFASDRKIFDKISKKVQSFLNRNISDYKREEFKSDND